MLSYKLDFTSCVIMLGFGKSSHILEYASVIWAPYTKCYIVTLEKYNIKLHVLPAIITPDMVVLQLWLMC